MRSFVIEFVLALSLTLGSLVSPVWPANASGIAVEGAFARASASPKATAGVVYFVVKNALGEADRLVRLTTVRAEAAMLHESVAKGDSVSMEAVEAVAIPAGGEVALKPGGLHVMLFGLSQPLKKGEHFTITLSFEKAGDVTIDVPVLGVAAAGP